MPITVTTTYSFTSDDGTALNETDSDTIDQDEDAEAPARYQCPVGTTREQILIFSIGEEFGAIANSDCTLMIVNRDDSNSVKIFMSDGGGVEHFFILGVDEWYYLPSCDGLAQVDAEFANAAGIVELLVFNNPGS